MLLKQCLYPILSTHPLEDIQSSSFISSPYVMYLLDCLRSLMVFNNKIISNIINNDNNNNLLLSLYCELLKLYVLFNFNSYIILYYIQLLFIIYYNIILYSLFYYIICRLFIYIVMKMNHYQSNPSITVSYTIFHYFLMTIQQ